MIYIDHGMIWPTIKARGSDNEILLPIVVNNDKTAIWRPQVVGDQDQEVDETLYLAEQLKDIVEEKVNKVQEEEPGKKTTE